MKPQGPGLFAGLSFLLTNSSIPIIRSEAKQKSNDFVWSFGYARY